MQKQEWEYLEHKDHREYGSHGWSDWYHKPDLARLGREGWELICVYPLVTRQIDVGYM